MIYGLLTHIQSGIYLSFIFVFNLTVFLKKFKKEIVTNHTFYYFPLKPNNLICFMLRPIVLEKVIILI